MRPSPLPMSGNAPLTRTRQASTDINHLPAMTKSAKSAVLATVRVTNGAGMLRPTLTGKLETSALARHLRDHTEVFNGNQTAHVFGNKKSPTASTTQRGYRA